MCDEYDGYYDEYDGYYDEYFEDAYPDVDPDVIVDPRDAADYMEHFGFLEGDDWDACYI